jgi:Uma2 family endonuclease
VPPPGELELPCDDGEPMESNEHRMQMVLLIQSLKEAWKEHEDFFVGGNMFIYFSEKQVKHNDFRGPDVFVVLDTPRRSRLSWVAWEEGKLPEVVIELTSRRTEHIDRGEKMQIYSAIWKTPAYFIFDPIRGNLDGYALDAEKRRYAPLRPDANGDLDCSVLGLKLGVREGRFEDRDWLWLRWLDPATGLPLPTPQERAEAERARAEAERARAEVERARAETLAARVAELEAQLAGARKP